METVRAIDRRTLEWTAERCRDGVTLADLKRLVERAESMGWRDEDRVSISVFSSD